MCLLFAGRARQEPKTSTSAMSYSLPDFRLSGKGFWRTTCARCRCSGGGAL